MSNDIVRTSKGLRDHLFEELETLRAGTSSPQRAKEVARLGAVIINSARLEAEFHKFAKDTGSAISPRPVLLGTVSE